MRVGGAATDRAKELWMTANTLSEKAQAVRAAAAGRYYGLMYLSFATLAYTDESAKQIEEVVADLRKDVAGLAPPPLPGGDDTRWGTWSLDWGPGLFNVDENLMYVASFRETGNPSPVLTVLAIRGTDTSAGIVDVLGEVFEDVRDWTHVRWSRASSDQRFECLPDLDPFDGSLPKIATGTCEGLQRLRQMTPTVSGSGSGTAEQYLQSLLAQDPALPIVVTGHSLGACQATVMAMSLSDVLPEGTRILPNPFAPPTAGNAAFAALYDARFPEGNVWWNTLDLVPNAFAKGNAATPGSLTFAEGLWQDHGGPSNAVFADTIKLLIGTLPQYVQPTAGNTPLPGRVATTAFLDDWYAPTPPSPWVAQLEWQHFTPNYYLLMKKHLPELAPYDFPGRLPTKETLQLTE
jgi:hypothetical protein